MGASVAVAQDGAIIFRNLGGGLNAPVLNTDGMTRLDGSGFSIQAYFAPAGTTDPNTLMPFGVVQGFNTGAFAGYTAGAPVITVPGIGIGSMAAIQFRAWDNIGGTVTSFEAADGVAARGTSMIIDSPALGDPLNAASIPSLTGLTTFSLQVVPEPSTVALGVIGGLALLMRRRK